MLTATTWRRVHVPRITAKLEVAFVDLNLILSLLEEQRLELLGQLDAIDLAITALNGA